MHVDKYVVNNIGTKWTNGKSKKLVPLLQEWFETVNGEWSHRNVELIINVKEED